MSHKRSGLLAGLTIGLVAALSCAAAVGVAVLFQSRLPAGIRSFGNGYPLSTALSLMVAVIVALTIGSVRPRSAVLPAAATLYAGAAVMGGQIMGGSIMWSAAQQGHPAPMGLTDITLDNLTGGLPYALGLYTSPSADAWPVWLSIAVAALAALLLVTLRIVRVRRAGWPAPETPAPEEEHRAPFQPAQEPAGSLFTPRKPTRD
jgi:hypothetical protein